MLDYELRWIYRARFVVSISALIIFGSIYFSGWYDFPFHLLAIAPLSLIIVNRPYSRPLTLIKNENVRLFIGQLLDVICITWGMHFVGGMNMFAGMLFYPLVIIYSSFILSARSTYFIANIAFVIYASMVHLEMSGVLPTISAINIEIDFAGRIIMTLIPWPLFNLTAYVSAHHSRALKLGRNELGKTINQLQNEIQEREKAERNVQLERHKLTSILDSIDEPVFVSDPQSYELLYVNEAFKNLWGDPQGKLCYEALHGFDTPCSLCNNTKLIEDIHNKSHVMEFKNKSTGKWFKCISKIIQWTDNRLVRYDMKIDITNRKRIELVQSVLFKISEAVNKTENLDELLKIIHRSLSTLMDTSNFYIALYDPESKSYSFPYIIDKYDNHEVPPEQMRKSLTDYVRRTGQSLWADDEIFNELIKKGEVKQIGKTSPIWIGAPLNTPHGVIGVVALQHYENPDTYTHKDLEVLTHVSGHIASAIERKIAERNLANTMSLLASTIESTADGILVVNNEGKVVYANKRYARLWRIPDEIMQTSDDNKLLNYVLEQLQNPVEFLIKVKELYNSSEEAYDTLEFIDGRIYERYSCPLKDGDMIVGRVWNFRDVTEAQKAQKLLLQSEHSYRSFLESMHDGVVIADLDENLLFVNTAFCKMLGYEADDILGRNLRDFVLEEDFSRVIIGTQKRIKKEHSRYDLRMKRKDGKIREILISATPLIDNVSNDVKGSVGIFSDITEMKKSERERRELRNKLVRAQRMESLGILAGGVAHDLNNILGPLVAYPDIIRMSLDKNHPVLNHIAKIETSALRAAGVVQDLLTMARRGRYEMKPVNINEIIEEYLNSADFGNIKAKYDSIELKLNLAPDLGNINGSNVHLSKVIMNLIINAMEAMPNGGKLSIRSQQKFIQKLHSGFDNIEAGEYILVIFEDTGQGIDQKDLIHLFEPFYTKKKMGRSGSGLGLAIVYGVIKDHNGYIDVESETNKGSRFYIYLPVCFKSETSSEYTPAGDIRGNEKILIVDDLEEQRDLAATILSSLGYETETAANGHQAITMAQDTAYDLIVLDMIMETGFDGLDTFKELLKIDPHQKAIIASGYSKTERVLEAEKLGVAKFLKKPYTMQILGKAIREVLQPVVSKGKIRSVKNV